jgi:hypothetical protein
MQGHYSIPPNSVIMQQIVPPFGGFVRLILTLLLYINSPTVSYIVAGGPGSQDYLAELRRQQGANGALPGSPDNFAGGDVWLTRWSGVAPTAWFYFAETASPFYPQQGCLIHLPLVVKP